jgi:hypothetical protein
MARHSISKQDAHASICACREWAEIVGELDSRGLMWIVADVIAELVPTGRAAVEAHKALHDYLSPQHVSFPQRFGYCSLLSCPSARAMACGLVWNESDIVAELALIGHAVVEAHKALYDYLSPQHVGYPFGIASYPASP